MQNIYAYTILVYSLYTLYIYIYIYIYIYMKTGMLTICHQHEHEFLSENQRNWRISIRMGEYFFRLLLLSSGGITTFESR